MQDRKIVHIPLSEIDLTDTRYRVSKAGGDLSSLALSIEQTGLAVPPLVCQAPKDLDSPEFIIVTGFKRITAMTESGWSTIPCQVMSGASERDHAICAISENSFQRELTPGELIRAIEILGRVMDIQTMADQALAVFNIQLNAGYIKALSKINTLGSQALELLESGRLSIKAAKKIVSLNKDFIDCFLRLFSRIKTSSSKQMEIITSLLEIAAREKTTPEKICGEKLFKEILEPNPGNNERGGHKDPGAAGNLVRTYLRQRRYPELEKNRLIIQKKVQALKLNPGIRIILPENFESMVYSISFDFKTPKEFQTQLSSIESLVTHPDFKEILDR